MTVPVAISSILIPKVLPATGNYCHFILLQSHIFFPFSPVCIHLGKQWLFKGFKATWKTINWHRNCPGGCQYQLLNCWYASIRQWICVITEWLSIGNVHIVVSPINGLQSVVSSVVGVKQPIRLRIDLSVISPKFEHTPNRDNYSDSYTGWGKMTVVLLHLIIIAVIVVVISFLHLLLSKFVLNPNYSSWSFVGSSGFRMSVCHVHNQVWQF